MGINFKKILGGVLDVGEAFHVPVLSQADAIVDAIKNSKATNSEKAALAAQVESLKVVAKTAAAPAPKGFLEGNRTKMLLIGIGATILANYGLPQETANQVMEWVAVLVGAGIAGDTLRPSTK